MTSQQSLQERLRLAQKGDLAFELHQEAAAAIDSLHRQLAERDADIMQLRNTLSHEYGYRRNAVAEATRLQALIVEARTALEPFAVMANQIDEWQNGTNPKVNFEFSADTLRIARTTLAKLKAAGKSGEQP